MAKFVLLDWKNIQDDDNKDVPYSKEMALKWLTEHSDFYRLVLDLSQDAGLYRDDEGSAGNSLPTSSGS
jgi:hypothetical protein